MEENTREGIIRTTRKEVVGCVQDMAEENNSPFKFEDGKKKEMDYFLLTYVCSKDEICLDMDETISELTPKERLNF